MVSCLNNKILNHNHEGSSLTYSKNTVIKSQDLIFSFQKPVH